MQVRRGMHPAEECASASARMPSLQPLARNNACLEHCLRCHTQVALFKPPDPAALEGGQPRTRRLGDGGGSSSGGSTQSDEPFFTVQDVLPSKATSEWWVLKRQQCAEIISVSAACAARV